MTTQATVARTLQLKIPAHINNRCMDELCEDSGLGANEAQGIALQWLTELQSNFEIGFTMAKDSRLCPTYDRVWFKLFHNDTNAAAVVRATAIVWSVLNQCRGYGVAENPEFWRRIFAIMYDSSMEKLHQVNTKQRNRLVPSAVALLPRDTTFPRVRVSIHDSPYRRLTDSEVNVWQNVCGIGECLFSDVQRTLDDILSRLAPFKKTHGTPVVNIAFATAKSIGCVPSAAELNNHVQPLLAPRFHVAEIVELYGHSGLDTIVVENRRELLQPSHTQPQNCSRLPPPTHVVIREPLANTTLEMKWLEYDLMMNLFSSLPFTKSCLDSVHFETSSFRPIPTPWQTILDDIRANTSTTVPDPVLPWIWYSIFHPDAVELPFSTLHITTRDLMHEIHSDRIGVYDGSFWRLPFTLSKTLNRSLKSIYWPRPSYKRVVLAAGTMLHLSPNGSVILTLPAPTFAELLNLSPYTGRSWRVVVVRSVGTCWVDSKAIVGPCERRPALRSPRIRNLVIETGSTYGTKVPNIFMKFVVRLSGNLVKLDIASISRFSDSQLDKILKANPQLKSLSVVNDGSLWRDEGVVWRQRSKWPRLSELKLVIGIRDARYFAPSEMSITTGSLQNLQSFVIVLATERSFDVSQEAFAWFINRHPRLSFVVIHPQDLVSSDCFCHAPRDYAQWKYLSEHRLDAAGVNRSAVLSRSNQRVQAVALMSVVHRLQQHRRHAIGEELAAFGADVVKCVLSFVGSSGERGVWFGPSAYMERDKF